MTTNLEVMLKAEWEIKKMRKRLKKTNISSEEREVLIESIGLLKTVSNQSVDAIREGHV